MHITKTRSPIALLGMAITFVTFGSATWAASLSVSPVNLFVASPAKAGAVSLTNLNKAPVQLQVRIFKWSQRNGEQVLEPTRDVIANPPSTEIPGEKTYTVRIARTLSSPVLGEESYRLMIDEVPAPADPDNPAIGVSMLLRTSLPVFFSAPKSAPKVQWRVWADKGQMHVEAANSGNRHIKLAGLAVEGATGRAPMNAAGSGVYVLPGSTLRYASAPGATLFAPGTMVTITTARGTPFEVKEQVIVTGT